MERNNNDFSGVRAKLPLFVEKFDVFTEVSTLARVLWITFCLRERARIGEH